MGDTIFCFFQLQEFESAVQQRDKVIEDLTTSLVQALGVRDSLVAQLNALNSVKLDNANVEKFTQEKVQIYLNFHNIRIVNEIVN